MGKNRNWSQTPVEHCELHYLQDEGAGQRLGSDSSRWCLVISECGRPLSLISSWRWHIPLELWETKTKGGLRCVLSTLHILVRQIHQMVGDSQPTPQSSSLQLPNGIGSFNHTDLWQCDKCKSLHNHSKHRTSVAVCLAVTWVWPVSNFLFIQLTISKNKKWVATSLSSLDRQSLIPSKSHLLDYFVSWVPASTQPIHSGWCLISA